MAMPDVSTADVAPWITRLARLGYAAKAVLYTLVGVLAFGVGRGVGAGRPEAAARSSRSSRRRSAGSCSA